MSQHRQHSPADESVTRALRAALGSLPDEAYWRGLERRIMTHVRESKAPGIAWWDELHAWARPALVAAAVLLIAVGVAFARGHQLARESAYAAVLTPTPLPVETAVRPVLEEPRDATLRYLITP